MDFCISVCLPFCISVFIHFCWDLTESVGVIRMESVGVSLHGQESLNEARSDKSLARFLAHVLTFLCTKHIRQKRFRTLGSWPINYTLHGACWPIHGHLACGQAHHHQLSCATQLMSSESDLYIPLLQIVLTLEGSARSLAKITSDEPNDARSVLHSDGHLLSVL